MKNVQMKSVMEMVIGAIKCCQVTSYNATIVKVMRKGIMSVMQHCFNEARGKI